MKRPALKLVTLAATVCLLGAGPATSAQPDLVIEHVTVLPMTAGGAAVGDATVVIHDGRIAQIAPATTKLKAAGRRIDGAGKWLMPSLADMHVHLENDRLMGLWREETVAPGMVRMADISVPYVINGVLQLANLSAMSEAIGQRIEVESGEVVGPHVALGAMIDGASPVWPLGMTRSAATPEDGRQAVRDIKAEGYDFVKVYNHLTLPTFNAIVDEARKQGLKVAGHLTERGKGVTAEQFTPGFSLVAHLQEYVQQTKGLSDADIQRFVAMTKANGTWVITTLSTDQRLAETMRDPEKLKTWPHREYLHPLMFDAWINHNRPLANRTPDKIARIEQTAADDARLLRAFHAAGVTLLPGTDFPMPGEVPGFALHDELEAMARAGMPNDAVLQSATRLPAEWLGVAEDRGTVAVGKRADLILLDADPRVDVANTRRIAAVFASGRYLPRSELDAMSAALLRRYAPLAAKLAASAKTQP